MSREPTHSAEWTYHEAAICAVLQTPFARERGVEGVHGYLVRHPVTTPSARKRGVEGRGRSVQRPCGIPDAICAGSAGWKDEEMHPGPLRHRRHLRVSAG